MSFTNDKDPIVSIIIATYNRPEMLKVCIKGVLNQTVENWKLYVIGDCCSETTGQVIDEFNDNRIIYYNNPFRFGEQGGGNSLGIALSDTEYIAFLNHDDIWLPNHLEVAMESILDKQTNFYIGKSIFTNDADKIGVPIFSLLSNNDRKPYWTYTAHFSLFEPCSTWVIQTSFAKKVGYWKQSIDIHRRPIQDYIMRSWKNGAQFKFGEQLTCIQQGHHNKLKETLYSANCEVSDQLFKMIEDTENFNQILLDYKLPTLKYRKNYRLGRNKFRKISYKLIHDLFVNRLTAFLYYKTGIDGYNILSNLLLLKRGKDSAKTLYRRTGETGFIIYDIQKAIDLAKNSIKEAL